MILWQIYVAADNETSLSLHVKCPIFFNQLLGFHEIFIKDFSIKIHVNPSLWNPP
jgi:hypothetical protein